MKLQVIYEPNDTIRAIRHDLARQGIPATDVSIKFTKGGGAVVLVDVTVDETSPPPDASVEAPAAAPRAPQAPPQLEAIEGGANPVDMTDILRQSAKTAAANPGKFPAPQPVMLDGESTEFPGGQ